MGRGGRGVGRREEESRWEWEGVVRREGGRFEHGGWGDWVGLMGG